MDGTRFNSDSEKGDRLIEAAIAIEEARLLVRAIGEWLGIVKPQELGVKKPEGIGFRGKIRNAQKSVIGAIDRLADFVVKGSPSLENEGKGVKRIILLVAITMLATAVNAVYFGFVRKPGAAQEKKLPEKVAPAPKKASGMKVHANDAFYRMAFGKTLARNTFATAAAQKRQPAANRLA